LDAGQAQMCKCIIVYYNPDQWLWTQDKHKCVNE